MGYRVFLNVMKRGSTNRVLANKQTYTSGRRDTHSFIWLKMPWGTVYENRQAEGEVPLESPPDHIDDKWRVRTVLTLTSTRPSALSRRLQLHMRARAYVHAHTHAHTRAGVRAHAPTRIHTRTRTVAFDTTAQCHQRRRDA